MTAPSSSPPAAASPPKTAAYFYSRVMKPRLLAAYIWATLATPLAGGVALILLGAKEGLFGILFSFAPYRLLFWTALAVSLLSHVSLRIEALSRVAPRVHSCRVGVFLALLRPSILGAVLLQAALGGAVVKSIVGVASPTFDSLAFEAFISVDSEETATTLHEGAVFVAAAGCFAAARMAVVDALKENSPFSASNGVRLAKMVRVRKGLMPSLLASLYQSLDCVKWFFLFYFFAGNVVKGAIFCPWLIPGQVCPSSSSSQVCNLSGHKTGYSLTGYGLKDGHTLLFSTKMFVTPMNSFMGLAEIGVLWKSFIAVTFLTFSRKLVKSIVIAYINEPLSFPLVGSALAVDDDEQPTLTATLKPAAGDSVPPLAELLAFQHLNDVLSDGPASRKPFFSLSQPGGHPHTWNAISSVCCDHLKTVLAGVVECNAAAATVTNNKPASTSTVMRLSPFRYLLQEFPGAKARKVFVESAKSISAASSLSRLVAASFEEDDYGVVQKRLSDILELLVNLYDAVDKNIKLYPCNGGVLATPSGGNGKSSAFFGSAVVFDDGADILATARPALRDVTKASIYRIAMTFGSHIFGIHGLTPETIKRLKSFVEVKE